MIQESSTRSIAQVPADTYPNLVRVGSELIASGFDCGSEFEFGLDLILDGIERMSGSPGI